MRSARAAREASFQTHGQTLDLRIPRPHGQPVFGDSCPPSRARADTRAEPLYCRSIAANDDPPDAAICGLIIPRLKKNGLKKGPEKGSTRQSDNVRFHLASRTLLQHNDFPVGFRGLETRTY